MEVLRHKSLKGQQHSLSSTERQLELIEQAGLVRFDEKLKDQQLFPLKSQGVETLQVNLGKMCNQVCEHCHVDAGPDRKEIMTKETMLMCLDAIDKSECHTVDLTGGAPEMNPNFEWFVEEIRSRGKKVIVRCNLTIIVANKKYNHLPEFFKKNNVEVVSSLPCYTEGNTDSQRGEGVFKSSIHALKMLNEVGYGKAKLGLILNLVYNPSGTGVPGSQVNLERDYKKVLKEQYDIEFNNLFTITNLPISRFLEYLVASENYEGYMQKLIDLYNPLAAENVMCRTTLSISWDGFIYDCDFNQMLDLKVKSSSTHLSDFDLDALSSREITTNQHCYGCTAGAGSSCAGATV
jgi:radical SAM/Cys-rich protein